jgi:HAD superfamily hydrolase (TIGR01509 family)
MVQGVPERNDHPPVPQLRPAVDAVLLDFHGTIAQVEDSVDWVLAAGRTCGVELDRAVATALADRLVTAGRAGGPRPVRVPPQLAEVYADRDLHAQAHRRAYAGLAATVEAGIDGFADALYERLLLAAGWTVYVDTLPTLKALAAANIPVAVVSNIGFDIRPICAELGLAEYVSAWVLSYELGRCKPDPAVFRHACELLGADPRRCLMVGDTPADGAAVDAGLRALLVPAGPPGSENGLSAVLTLALGAL